MIELIFVIVIIGILAAVALPKMVGTANEAHNANIKSFVSTLNNTVGPAMWSKKLSEGGDGNISSMCTEAEFKKYVDIPKEVEVDTTNKCDFDVKTSTGATGCINLITDGNATNSPSWDYNSTSGCTGD
jgi:type II secretory pathway pseudopilin PulG